MQVNATGPETTPLGPKRPNKPPQGLPPDSRGPARARPVPSGKDRVEISGEARALSASQDEISMDQALSPERMKQVLGRIAQGFYESREVQEEVLREVADDLGIHLSGS